MPGAVSETEYQGRFARLAGVVGFMHAKIPNCASALSKILTTICTQESIERSISLQSQDFFVV